MLLLVPDKAELRSVACLSAVSLLESLYDVRSLSAIHSIISFLSNLFAAAKVMIRSVSIEVGASILHRDWVWSLASKSGSLVGDLFLSIVRRCYDVAPSIRLRSLAVLSGLLVKAFESHDQLHSFIIEKLDQPVLEEQTLHEVFRECCFDDRPLVRAKALAAVEIISLQYSSQPSLDDLDIFAEACEDKSVAVRKQALVSLIALSQAYPQNSCVMEIFIESALPRVYDTVCVSFILLRFSVS